MITLFNSFSVTRGRGFDEVKLIDTNVIFNSFSMTGRRLAFDIPSYNFLFKSFSMEKINDVDLLTSRNELGYIIRQ